MKVALTKAKCLDLLLIANVFSILLKLLKKILKTEHWIDLPDKKNIVIIVFIVASITEYSTSYNDRIRKHFANKLDDTNSLLLWELFDIYRIILVQSYNSLNELIFNYIIEKLQCAITNCFSSNKYELKKDYESHYAYNTRASFLKIVDEFIYNIFAQDNTLIERDIKNKEQAVLYTKIIQTACIALKHQHDTTIMGCLRMLRYLFIILSKHPNIYYIIAEMINQIPLRPVEYLVYVSSFLSSIFYNTIFVIDGVRRNVIEYSLDQQLIHKLQLVISKKTGNDLKKALLTIIFLCKQHPTIFRIVEQEMSILGKNLKSIMKSDSSIEQFIQLHCLSSKVVEI
jgi:hypothetical protein